MSPDRLGARQTPIFAVPLCHLSVFAHRVYFAVLIFPILFPIFPSCRHDFPYLLLAFDYTTPVLQ